MVIVANTKSFPNCTEPLKYLIWRTILIMLSVIACLIGIFGLLVVAELIGKHRILKGEYHRKFLHIAAGSFIAFWPWLISWPAIELISLIMLGVMVANHYLAFLNYRGRIGRASYGDMFLALAIFLSAHLTHNKVFFMIAILEVSVADGLAAVAGITYGKNWAYKIFGYKKTVIGSMVFWIASVCILGAGLLFAHDIITFQNYYLLLLLLPPAFTLAENFSIFGLDNLIIPLLTIAILRAVAMPG
jgi:phytol kinase